jgi:hypothetical protein
MSLLTELAVSAWREFYKEAAPTALSRNHAVGSATVSVALAGPRASVSPIICSNLPPASRMPWMIHHSVSIRTASKFSSRRRKQRSRRPRSQKQLRGYRYGAQPAFNRLRSKVRWEPRATELTPWRRGWAANRTPYRRVLWEVHYSTMPGGGNSEDGAGICRMALPTRT